MKYIDKAFQFQNGAISSDAALLEAAASLASFNSKMVRFQEELLDKAKEQLESFNSKMVRFQAV